VVRGPEINGGGVGGVPPLTSSSPHLLPVHADTVPAVFVPPLTGFPDTGDQPVRAFRVLLPLHGRVSPVAPQLVHTGKCIRKSIGAWLAGSESACFIERERCRYDSIIYQRRTQELQQRGTRQTP